MNYLQEQSEIIALMRGNATQRGITKRLALGPHRIHRVEKMQAILKWDEFLRLCRSRNINTGDLLRATLDLPTSPINIQQLLQILKNTNETFPSQQLLNSLSRFKLYRWSQGTSQPKLTDVLKIFHIEFNAIEKFKLELRNHCR